MTPPEPGMFWITTCWPRSLRNASPRIRVKDIAAATRGVRGDKRDRAPVWVSRSAPRRNASGGAASGMKAQPAAASVRILKGCLQCPGRMIHTYIRLSLYCVWILPICPRRLLIHPGGMPLETVCDDFVPKFLLRHSATIPAAIPSLHALPGKPMTDPSSSARYRTSHREGFLRAGINLSNFLLVTGRNEAGDPGGRRSGHGTRPG